jgi:hypothetical protein
MPTATERVSVLMTPDQKMRLVSEAREAGISVSEYMRRAVNAFHGLSDDLILSSMIDEMNNATIRAEKSIDETLKYVDESNQRIAQMERCPSIFGNR